MTTTLAAPRAHVSIDGIALAADVSNHLLSVRYDNDLDLADMFTLVVDNAGNRFTDSPLFAPGATVEIHLGYGADLQPMMRGRIAAIEPDFPASGAPTLTITGYDRSHRMRHHVPDRPPFEYMTDSAIAAQIAVENGLIPVVDPALYPPHRCLPSSGTDMALLKERARANHFEVYVWWDRLYFRFPRPQTEAHVLEYGRNLVHFTPRLSTGEQAGMQVVRGYNEQLAQTIIGVMTTPALDLDTIVERLGTEAMELLAGLGRRVIRGQPVRSPIEAGVLARALLQELLDGMYEASGSCPGIPELRAGRHVEVRGVGKRFSGTYRLTRVTHALDGGGYHTDFGVTQRAGSSLLGLVRSSVADRPPPDDQPRVPGAVVGTVRSVDPATATVAVNVPSLSGDNMHVHATYMAPMAGRDRGMYFLPDPGDQVLVAFDEGSTRHAFVIGSVWAANQEPVSLDDRNRPIQRIRTASGHTLTFDDTSGSEQLVISHPTGSSVVLEADGSVVVTAKKDLDLRAPNGEIRLDARDVNVTVDNLMDVSGR